MTILPGSIAAYLEEYGFSTTEVLLIKTLLDTDALTLREISSITRKSTGMLDNAMKKLLQKGIVVRETINGSPKYTLHSLQSVTDWLKANMQEQQQMIVRRCQTIESYVETVIKQSNVRPDMEYFDGPDGLKKAYRELFNRGHVILRYGPTLTTPDDDPHHDMRIEFFRECHSRDIFPRVITHDTPNGRKYQSRDPFEHRGTVLVDPESYPFLFDKYIVGDTVACFQPEKNTACFIRFAALAEHERTFFECLWRKKQSGSQMYSSTEPIVDAEVIVPAPKNIFPHVRTMLIGVILSLVCTVFLYQYTQHLSLRRMQDKVLAIASTAAAQFDAADVQSLQTKDDWKKPQWAKLVQQVANIRRDNSDVRFVYIIRKTATDQNALEFVTDADSLNPFANVDDDTANDVDENGDGKIDGSSTGGDYLSWPGQLYVDAPQEGFDAYHGPVASKNFYTDQWGKTVSGYAPIRDKNGTVAAVLAVDMMGYSQQGLTRQAFTPLYAFLGFFAAFLLFSARGWIVLWFQGIMGRR